MSFLEGIGFRSSTPSFESGDVISVIITDFDREAGHGYARIGDTLLNISGVGAEDVDEERDIEVTAFNSEEHRGQAKLV